MKKVIITILTIICIFVGGYFLISSQSVANENAAKDNKKMVDTAINKLKEKEEYKDVSESNWNDISKDLKSRASSSEEFNQSYEWTLKGSLDKYSEDKSMGLISYKKLKEKIKAKEDIMVMYSQPICPHCTKLKESGFKKYAVNATKDGKKVYMVNAAIESAVWKDKSLYDKSKSDSKSDNESIPGTPALVHYKNGKFESTKSSEEYSEVKEYLTKEGF